ncbi:MAG TPA: hypothetical protein VKW06_14645 [Candidatus Angelobacter sp.]|nr:hypothetical protein [Candidatus Angelobacter sp.]
MKLRVVLFLAAAIAVARAAGQHGTLIRPEALHVTPGASSQTLLTVERGRDMVLLEAARNDEQGWSKVFVTLAEGESRREVTGWLLSKGLVVASTPNADQIIFGEAVDSEAQAEQRGGRKGAATDAMRLYYRVWDIFPQSPLAPEALWRSADIRWQLEKADLRSRPSSPGADPDLRPPMDDSLMKQIISKFPGTRWADLAAYEMIDNKLCREWNGLARCPESEAELYANYARDHPASPKSAEALYNAAWRQAVLADIYRISNVPERSSKARQEALALARKIVALSPDPGDWKPRALDLIYVIEQGIHVYGAQTD